MDLRFVTKRVHAFLDYPVAITLLVAPFVLGLGTTHPLAKWLSIGTGAAAFTLTLFTDHQTGLVRVLPYWVHRAVDALVGVVFLAAPVVLGFSGIDALYYWANGGAVMLVVGLHKPEPATPRRPEIARSESLEGAHHLSVTGR